MRLPRPTQFVLLLAWGAILLGLDSLGSRALGQSSSAIPERPNILWITCEDTGPQIGCYGDSYSSTPNLDRFAQRSLRFSQCWSNAPVCAPARTTLISGLYPTSYGAQHMRSSVSLPAGSQTLPSLLRRAGYYCTNNSKEDYNFPKPQGMWDESSNKAHWRHRNSDQPFFAVFNSTVTHEGQIRKRPYSPKHDPSLAPIPPYHPDDPEVRLDWAQYYDRISEMDEFVGRHLKELEQAGLADSTVVFFFGDHGYGLPRGKRWLYQSGLHVPMLVHIPAAYARRFEEVYRPGGQSDRLVSFVDLMPTVLDLCQLPIPEGLHGRSFFVPQQQANRYLFGFRDRMDERGDSSRCIRNDRYLYIRNFMPDRPQGAHLNYMFQTPTTQVWKRLYDQGALNAVQKAFWEPKPVEELYDLQADPHQVTNIASADDVQEHRKELANALKSKMQEMQDTGSIPEDWIRHERKQDMTVALDAAWKSGLANVDPELLLTMLQSPDVIERYWGAVAFRAGNAGKRDPRIMGLAAGLLNDPSLEVRATLAEALARNAEDQSLRSTALDVLIEIPLQQTAPWGARVIALNALCDLGVSDTQAERIQKAFESQGESWSRSLPDRYSEYLARLVATLSDKN